jgi:membrane fusion protein (multidrug efflux system)
MEDVARRVADAQAAEQDLVNRIMQARSLEEEAAREVQRKAEEHVKAQWELRRLDALSARYSVPRAQYEQSRNEEYAARQKLEKARAAREEYSRARAAVDGELSRIKAELAELKAAGGQTRSMPGHEHRAAQVPPRAPSAPESPDIVAPENAVVADVFTQPGLWAQPQQQLIALMPEAGAYEATAWFSEKDGAHIQAGQMCRVFVLELPEKSFWGKVEQVLPAGGPAPQLPLAASMQARQIPVRIRFFVNDSGSHAALKSGMRAAVRVHKFTPPWTLVGAFAEKMIGKR